MGCKHLTNNRSLGQVNDRLMSSNKKTNGTLITNLLDTITHLRKADPADQLYMQLSTGRRLRRNGVLASELYE